MSTIRLRPAATSAQERASIPTTCQCCGRENLKRTVKMTDGTAVLWLGVGCAAKSMGVGLKDYQKAADAVQGEADAKERAAHKAADDAFQAWLDKSAGPRVPYQFERLHQLAKLGGMNAARDAYHATLNH